ncbi:hypothetical protein [Actinomadura kijaniata]|uniref:hypothetical protein n=1 Tax=Actinomadura kijaniata TaxID=46161 RepID=UPI00083034C7|nr:hypothetical protein [Actinomadura kijaniata]
MIRRFAAGTAVATGLTLALTGCLGEAKNTAGEAGENIRLTAAQVLGKAADKTAQTDTFKAEVTVDGKLTQGSMNMKMTMETRLRPEVAMRMVTSPTSVAGQTVPGMEMRLVGDAMYMKMPQMAARNGGKPWARISLDAVGQAAGGVNYRQLLDQAKQQSPADQVKMFTTSKDVQQVGTETVDGVRTTHYKGTYNPQEALTKLDPQSRQAMERTYAQLGTTAIPFDLWVGDDSLPRKMTMSMQTAMGTMSTTALYRDYGKPIQVAVPPASEVGDMKMPGVGN